MRDNYPLATKAAEERRKARQAQVDENAATIPEDPLKGHRQVDYPLAMKAFEDHKAGKDPEAPARIKASSSEPLMFNMTDIVRRSDRAIINDEIERLSRLYDEATDPATTGGAFFELVVLRAISDGRLNKDVARNLGLVMVDQISGSVTTPQGEAVKTLTDLLAIAAGKTKAEAAKPEEEPEAEPESDHIDEPPDTEEDAEEDTEESDPPRDEKGRFKAVDDEGLRSLAKRRANGEISEEEAERIYSELSKADREKLDTYLDEEDQ